MKITPSAYKNQNFTAFCFHKNKKPYSYVLKNKFPFIEKKYKSLFTPQGLYSKAELEAPVFIPESIRAQVETYKQNKQKLPDNVYFIRMESYEKNKEWAKDMEELTYLVSYLISQKMPFENLMAIIEKEIKRINKSSYFGAKRMQNDIFQVCEIGRGSEYYDKYIYEMSDKPDRKIKPKAADEFDDVNLSTIRWDKKSSCVEISYGKMGEKSTNLKHIKNLYELLIRTKNPNEEQINRTVAAIHWLFAQQTPYERGSDSIANLLSKSIYHCYDIEISPIKKCHSFDFEAFHLDIDDFVERYTDFFEKYPRKLLS